MRTLLQLLPGRDHRGPWLYWTRSKKTQQLWNISFQISRESYRIATSVTGPIIFRFLILFLHTTSDSQTSFCALFDCGNRIANAKFICTGEQRCVEGRVKINIDSNERTREAKPTGRKTAVPPHYIWAADIRSPESAHDGGSQFPAARNRVGNVAAPMIGSDDPENKQKLRGANENRLLSALLLLSLPPSEIHYDRPDPSTPSRAII